MVRSGCWTARRAMGILFKSQNMCIAEICKIKYRIQTRTHHYPYHRHHPSLSINYLPATAVPSPHISPAIQILPLKIQATLESPHRVLEHQTHPTWIPYPSTRGGPITNKMLWRRQWLWILCWDSLIERRACCLWSIWSQGETLRPLMLRLSPRSVTDIRLTETR